MSRLENSARQLIDMARLPGIGGTPGRSREIEAFKVFFAFRILHHHRQTQGLRRGFADRPVRLHLHVTGGVAEWAGGRDVIAHETEAGRASLESYIRRMLDLLPRD